MASFGSLLDHGSDGHFFRCSLQIQNNCANGTNSHITIGYKIFIVGSTLECDRVPGFDSVEDTLPMGRQASSGRCIERGIAMLECGQNMPPRTF